MWDPEATHHVQPIQGWLEKRGEKGVSLYLKAKQQRRYFRTTERDGVPVLLYYISSEESLDPLGHIYFGRGAYIFGFRDFCSCPKGTYPRQPFRRVFGVSKLVPRRGEFSRHNHFVGVFRISCRRLLLLVSCTLAGQQVRGALPLCFYLLCFQVLG